MKRIRYVDVIVLIIAIIIILIIILINKPFSTWVDLTLFGI